MCSVGQAVVPRAPSGRGGLAIASRVRQSLDEGAVSIAKCTYRSIRARGFRVDVVVCVFSPKGVLMSCDVAAFALSPIRVPCVRRPFAKRAQRWRLLGVEHGARSSIKVHYIVCLRYHKWHSEVYGALVEWQHRRGAPIFLSHQPIS